MPYRYLLSMSVCLMFAMGDARAGLDVFVYPAKGQAKEQQEQDEHTCYKWSSEQTGFDPTHTVQQVAPPASEGAILGGAARGAVLGVIGGAIAGDAGTGAAIGAGVGATGGALGRRHATLEAEAAQEQAKQQYEASLAGYKRAFTACMTARGYTVN
jgi:predicted lipid-binding transport protein (Tim44 family)